MNILEQYANNVFKLQIDNGKSHNEVLPILRNFLENIHNKFDKIKFMQIIISKTNDSLQKHKNNCTDINCKRDYNYSMIIYLLQQELIHLGVKINENSFSKEETIYLNEQLDIIIFDIQKLKNGQEIIYEDLYFEIQELKELYHIGKKNWVSLLSIKLTEMISSGIISETISKSIIDYIN